MKQASSQSGDFNARLGEKPEQSKNVWNLRECAPRDLKQSSGLTCHLCAGRLTCSWSVGVIFGAPVSRCVVVCGSLMRFPREEASINGLYINAAVD